MAGNQTAWGIDVGVSSLKALKLRREGDRVAIEAFEVIEHDKFLTEPDVDRDALIRATLQKFVTKNAVRRDVVFIGVPGNTTFSRFVKLPPVETKKIPEIVRFEAVQQIPFPLDQVNWDFHTFQHPDSPDVEVGIFAMKKELVSQVMSNFRALDLNVQGVQMSPLAVYNGASYDGMTQDKGTVVIDMGAEHTDLVVMDQGRVWLRSINIGGNHFTDALAKSFKQPFARAESLKKTAATSKYQKQIYQAMRPIFADLVAEIQRSLGAYNSAHRDSKLERIVGMGNPFKLPNLQKYLQQELKMDVERLENYRMANVEKAAAFSENILSMTTAYGLAVQALGLAAIDTNLLPSEMARAMMWKKKQPWFVAAAAVLALGALGNGVRWYAAKSTYESTANEALKNSNNQEFQKADALVKQWKGVNDTFTNAEKAVDEQFKLLAGRKVWPMMITEVWQAVSQTRQNNQQIQIVITDVNSEYSANLSNKSLAATAGGPAAPAGPGFVQPPVPPGAMVQPPVPPGAMGGGGNPATPGAAGAAGVTGQVGPSDHGYAMTIMGYYRVPPADIANRSDYRVFYTLKSNLMSRAPVTNVNLPYYFEGDAISGRTIKVSDSPTPVGGGVGFPGGGGAMGGMQPGDKPWGNVHGPFWDIFVPDMLGIPKPTAPAGGGGGMMFGGGGAPGQPTDLQPIDVVFTRSNPSKPVKTTMNNCYTFTLKFKAHIKDDFKEAPATQEAPK